jgi:hypothetical protein
VTVLHDLSEIVDLRRYPIDSLGTSAAASLLDHVHSSLDEAGACDLPGFLLPDAVARSVTDAEKNRDRAFRMDHRHDVEFSNATLADLAADDVRRHHVRTAKGGVPYDLISDTSPVRHLFESDVMLAFIAAALGAPSLHRMADPLGALNVMFYESGDELGWHFDRAGFVVTLLLQGPESGGAFEYVPMLRTEDDANPLGVAALLAGSRTDVRTTAGEPGTLALFRGHLSPHRVTPVGGVRPRINAVLAYSRQADHRLDVAGQMRFYGRTSSI